MEYVSSLVSELSWLETLVVVGISVISLYIVKDILTMLLAPPTQPYVAVKREPPVQRDWKLAELKPFNGRNGAPIYISAKGKVFDMSSSPGFYGPEGAYGVFAGHDASRCLATMSLNPEDLDKSVEGLSAADLDVLDEWVDKYMGKYPCLGTLTDAPYFEGQKER